MIPINMFVSLSIVMFAIGIFGVTLKRNPIVMLMGIELMLNSANINFIAFSRYYVDGYIGQIFAMFVIVVAAAEAAIGLAIVLRLFRNFGTVNIDVFNRLRW
ncbi:MAG: NADH-quinone oxidoreductase subunit NuoK [Archaeoglobaceae archaeon]